MRPPRRPPAAEGSLLQHGQGRELGVSAGAAASGLTRRAHAPASRDESASGDPASRNQKKKKKEKKNQTPKHQNTHKAASTWSPPGAGRGGPGETRPRPRYPAGHTRALTPPRTHARVLCALRGGVGSQTPEELVAEKMLVTKSSQLPQISSAKVCWFQVFEELPGPRQLSDSAPPTSWSPRGRSWRRGQVKVILALGHSLPTSWSSRRPDPGDRGPSAACTGDSLPRPEAASSPPLTSP